MASKLVGGGIFVLGLLITVAFPGIGTPSGYQWDSMGWAGVLIGLALMGIGIWILKT